MKKVKFLILGLLALLQTANLFAQQREDFSSCAAAFLDQKMIVDEYSTEGKCELAATVSGKLTVRPVTLEAGKDPVPGKKIPFKVAMRSGSSKTLMLLSEKTYEEVDIRPLLDKCKKGDYLVLLTLEREWALPHSEILVK